MSGRTISRRRFLRGAGASLAAFYIVPRHVLGGPGHTPPSAVITRAVIGVGGMGMNHVTENDAGRPPQTLAVCDVDRSHLDQALQKAGRSCDGYHDFREVLERRDIDVIYIATPPHWHALIAIAAAQAGFDILGEKPTTRTIGEGQALADAVRRYGRIYQVNTHGRFGACYQFGASRLLRKLADSGLLGTPLTVRVSRSLGFDWKVKRWAGRTDLTAEPVPDVLDYDMWLGPATEKPYHPHRVHGSFRGYWDYDGGGLSDMGQHYLDPVQYILNKDHTSPVEIEAAAPWPPHPDAVGMWGAVRLRYDDGTTILLHSGEWEPAREFRISDLKSEMADTKPEISDLRCGDEPGQPFLAGPEGQVFDNYRTEPAGLFDQIAALPDPPPLIDFETAVRTRQQPGGDADVTHRSCTLVNLANIAIRTGRKLRYDPVAQRFIGDEQADRFINPPMRAPWHL